MNKHLVHSVNIHSIQLWKKKTRPYLVCISQIDFVNEWNSTVCVLNESGGVWVAPMCLVCFQTAESHHEGPSGARGQRGRVHPQPTESRGHPQARRVWGETDTKWPPCSAAFHLKSEIPTLGITSDPGWSHWRTIRTCNINTLIWAKNVSFLTLAWMQNNSRKCT